MSECHGTLICNHDEVCSRCGRARCVSTMRHTRLNGYECFCGGREWELMHKCQNCGCRTYAVDLCITCAHNKHMNEIWGDE